MRALPLHKGARGLADDCAVLEFGGEALVLTHDAMAEGVHWKNGADPADVAWRLVASNLSDLAAKGADPLGVLLGYSLAGGVDDARFVEGLAEALHAFDTAILGGDTVHTGGAPTHGLTAIGRATHRPVPARTAAGIGDALYVTGVLGRAMLGFEGDAQHAAAFNRPSPRLDEGLALASHVTAMMDVSDGLLLDAFRMAEASGVTIALNTPDAPVAAPDRRMECLTWGDDYELLFTLPAGASAPVSATEIGRVEPRGFAPLVVDGEPVMNAGGLGYQHG